jgi:hypothetical protein
VGKKVGLEVIYGDEEAHYNQLWDYANEIRRSNPGSSFFVSLDENSRFKRAYMCLEASKQGFLQGCLTTTVRSLISKLLFVAITFWLTCSSVISCLTEN